MIGLVLGCALCLSIGWNARDIWKRRRVRLVKADVSLSPYLQSLAEFDRRIKFARDHHMSVKYIIDEKASFVKAGLEGAREFERELNALPDSGLEGLWRPYWATQGFR